jgi:GIY-YIG catalytic domain
MMRDVPHDSHRIDFDMRTLLEPQHLWSAHEVLTTACVPRAAGVYAWYFRAVPPTVPVDGCVVRDRCVLLYAGIAPKAPPQDGRRASAQTLHHRIRYHLRGNAEGSTLRLTLGCLLGIELRRVGSGQRRTFTATGEAKLSEWMAENAAVCWTETSEPWPLESHLISAVPLPLNLDQNRNHPFHTTLSALRRDARRRADRLPVVAR